MIARLLVSGLVMSLCVTIHAVGSTAMLRRLDRPGAARARGFWSPTLLLVRMAAWLVLMHLVEISLWGLLYSRGGAIPDLHSAVYFSAVTYTTTGYGDLVLPHAWRLVGGVEALTGILMSGWSTGMFFSALTRLQATRRAAPSLVRPATALERDAADDPDAAGPRRPS